MENNNNDHGQLAQDGYSQSVDRTQPDYGQANYNQPAYDAPENYNQPIQDMNGNYVQPIGGEQPNYGQPTNVNQFTQANVMQGQTVNSQEQMGFAQGQGFIQQVPVNYGQSLEESQRVLEELRSRKKGDTLTGMIVLFGVGITALVFFGLFVWMFIKWNQAKTNVEGQIESAKALAVMQEANRLNLEFEEKEKNPLRRFSGPVDYGEVSFEYPKTWSAYIEKDARNGGEYSAIFNPDLVNLNGKEKENVQALRFKILDTQMDKVIKNYESLIKKNKMKHSVVVVGGNSANMYDGVSESGKKVKMVIFSIRDKTVVIMTDAAKQYGGDFVKILKSITYNK